MKKQVKEINLTIPVHTLFSGTLYFGHDVDSTHFEVICTLKALELFGPLREKTVGKIIVSNKQIKDSKRITVGRDKAGAYFKIKPTDEKSHSLYPYLNNLICLELSDGQEINVYIKFEKLHE